MLPPSYPPRRPRSTGRGERLARALHRTCYLTLAVAGLSGHHDALVVGVTYLVLAALVERPRSRR